MSNPYEQMPVAIVGMACRFPGADNLSEYRDNLKQGVDAIREFPQARFRESYYDPQSTAVDRIYCKRGGFIGDSIEVDPSALGIMPVAAAGAEPDQLLALQLTIDAIENAGGMGLLGEPKRTGVIFGRGGYIGIRAVTGFQRGYTAQQIKESFRNAVPGLSEEQLQAIKEEFLSQIGQYGSDTAIGLVPNIAASRVANYFDFQGAAYTLDAACASTLIATDHAIRELESGRADAVIAGGIHLCNDMAFWNIFSRLGAISRTGQIRPFDSHADGLLIGEGVGVFVLKRLDDARRDGNPVHAVIRGSGIASDGHGKTLMQPSNTGQLLAMTSAWERSGLSPASIGLLEAHGTGTPEGDSVELETVSRFFDATLPQQPVIGSVKSMIGHLMPAAGAAGMIKTALALSGGFLPPTLHCDEPHVKLAQSGFRTISASEAWDVKQGGTRLAAVNAFGFGGINGHVVMESEAQAKDSTAHFTPRQVSECPAIRLYSASDQNALMAAIKDDLPTEQAGRYRLALENPTAERRKMALKIIAHGKHWAGRKGIWYVSGEGFAEKGKVAFLFPGFDGKFQVDVADLAQQTGLPLPYAPDLPDALEYTGDSIIYLGMFLADLLDKSGLRADAYAGHSIGEWAAMVASGIVPRSEADQFRNEFLATLRIEVPGVSFLAAGTDAETARSLMEDIQGVEISNDNCPHQIILCGEDAALDQVQDRFKKRKILCERLPFRSGFHSSVFSDYLSQFHEGLEHFSLNPPDQVFYSATTLEPYPAKEEEIRRLFFRHLVEPVRFHELTEKLYAEGYRVFIQLGAGRLKGFVGDTLREREHLVLSAVQSGQSALTEMRRMISGLWCEGYDVDLGLFGIETQLTDKYTQQASKHLLTLPLATEMPLVRTPIDIPDGAMTSAVNSFSIPVQSGALGEAFAALQQELNDAGASVLSAWQQHTPAVDTQTGERVRPEPTVAREQTWEKLFSLSEIPCIRDHCLTRQPPDWPDDRDRFAVVPMMYSLTLLLELAQEMFPHSVPIAIEKVRAYRWLEVEPPVTVTIHAVVEDDGRVAFKLGEFLEAKVVIAEQYPPAPYYSNLDVGEIESRKTAKQLYDERWAFHGSSYQGLSGDVTLGKEGAHGGILDTGAPGVLLDAATQLAGYWIAAWTKENQLALPFRIDRISLYAAKPAVGSLFEGSVVIRKFTDNYLKSDLYVHQQGVPWAVIENLEHRRFEGGQRVRKLSLFPESSAYVKEVSAGIYAADEDWRAGASRLFIARSFLNQEELEKYYVLPVKEQRAWLLGRIVLKDSLRRLYWKQHPQAELYPIQVVIEEKSDGVFGASTDGFAQADFYLVNDPGLAVSISTDITDTQPLMWKLEEITHAAAEGGVGSALPGVSDAERARWHTRTVAQRLIAWRQKQA